MNQKKIELEIQEKLFENQDLKYKDFQSKLIPNVQADTIIGVRTPVLRKLAKSISNKKKMSFIECLPHKYYDENQLHAFIISDMKDEEKCFNIIEDFLPYVNNWATCDQMTPKVFKKNKEKLLEHVKVWLNSKKEYTVRFAIKMLMTHFLEDDFRPEYLIWVGKVSRDEYYIKMMQAWYFATALSKQYKNTIYILEGKKLGIWVHNKSIQKAVESRRIPKETKEYLKTLKVKEK